METKALVIWAAGWFSLAYILLSIKILKHSEIGAVFFFGKPWKEVGSGIVFVPLFLASIRIFPTTIIQSEIPGEPEDVQKSNQDNIQEGKKAPVRIVQPPAIMAQWYDRAKEEFIPWKEYSEQLSEGERMAILNDPLNVRITSEPQGVIAWRHEKGRLFDFIEIIGSIDAANQQLSDTAVRTWQKLLGSITVGHANQILDIISEKMKEDVEKLVFEYELDPTGKKVPIWNGSRKKTSWGINLEEASLKTIDPGEHVNTAIAEASAAVSRRKETIENAMADAKAKKIMADAKAEEEMVTGTAENEILELKAATMSKPGAQFAAQLETAEKVFSQGKHTIIQGDLAGVIGSVSKIVDVVKE